MPDFSIYFMTPAERILGRDAIQAGSEREAIKIGLGALQQWNTTAMPTQRAFAVEIWCGANRVFAGRPTRPSVRTIDDPNHWRKRSEEARVLADKLTDTTAQRAMRDIAAGYQAMAERASGFSAEHTAQPQ